MKTCRAGALLLIAVFLGASEIAVAQDAVVRNADGIKDAHVQPRHAHPEPPKSTIAIPQQFSPPQEAYAAFPEPALAGAPSAPVAPSACQLRLAKVAVFQSLPVLEGAGECGAADAVLLKSVILSDQAKVAVAPPATLRCSMAEEIAVWVRDDVAAVALKLGAPLRGLENYDSYECRGRNRVRGAMLSEHGRANALDIRGLRLASGGLIGLTDVNVAKDLREELRASACARFSTVLGPGSDGNHEEHIHLDLAERRGGYKMCEWDVRAPVIEAKRAAPDAEQPAVAKIEEPVPLPRPRPVFADASIKPRPKRFHWPFR